MSEDEPAFPPDEEALVEHSEPLMTDDDHLNKVKYTFAFLIITGLLLLLRHGLQERRAK
jgi:hypothetical protein